MLQADWVIQTIGTEPTYKNIKMNLQARLVHLLMYENDTVSADLDALESQKYIILLAMFLTTVCFGILPLRILYLNQNMVNPQASHNIEDNENIVHQRKRKHDTKTKRWKKMISFANCFSGGVFVGACLLDLFPGMKHDLKFCSINEMFKSSKI